jgi:hypothetical protein
LSSLENGQRSIRYYRCKEAWPAETPEIASTFTSHHFKPGCINSFQTFNQASAPTSNMCCFPWLSALFGHSTWHSSDAPSQPLSQELQVRWLVPFVGFQLLTDENQRRNITSEDHGYQATKPMPQPPTVTLKRDRVGLANWRSYSDSFGQESRDQLTYKPLESMQQLPPVGWSFTYCDGYSF